MKRVLLALALLPVSLVAQEKPEAPKPKVAARVLTALNAATAFADAGYTASKTHRKDFVENDPLAKPLVHHTPLAMTVVAGEVIGLNWLASRMRRSDRWRRVWWLPQSVAIAAHACALGTTVRNFSDPGNPLSSRWAHDRLQSRTIGGTK